MAFNIPHSFIHPSMPCIINIYTLYKQMLCVCLYVQRAVAIYLVSCLVAAKVIVPWLYTIHVHQFSVRSFVRSILHFFIICFTVVPIQFLRSLPENFQRNEQYKCTFGFSSFSFWFSFLRFSVCAPSIFSLFLFGISYVLYGSLFVACLDSIWVFQSWGLCQIACFWHLAGR